MAGQLGQPFQPLVLGRLLLPAFQFRIPTGVAYFLVQQQVHEVSEHQRPRGFIGQKRVQQGPFGDGPVFLGALGHGGYADEVVGLEHHAAGAHGAIGQFHGPHEVQGGVQRGGQRQHIRISRRQPHQKGSGRPARGRNRELDGEHPGPQIGVQHPHPPHGLGQRRAGRLGRRRGFRHFRLRSGRGRGQRRPRVGRAGEVQHQPGHGGKAPRGLGRRAGVAFVQHQVGRQAQCLQLLAQGGGQLVGVGDLPDGLVEVNKRGLPGLAVVAQHGFEQLAQLGQLVGGRGRGIGDQCRQAGVVTGRHGQNGK